MLMFYYDVMQNHRMMSPVVGQTALSGYPTYAVSPARCRDVAVNGCAVTVNRAEPSVGSNFQQTGGSLNIPLASVRYLSVRCSLNVP